MCGDHSDSESHEAANSDPSEQGAPQGASRYQVIPGAKAPIKAWVDGVGIEPEAERQLRNTANLPFIYKWIAAMPDVHWGLGATVGSVIPTHKAIIPAAVGVDIGCGMMAVKLGLEANRLPDKLKVVRTAIEKAVPHGASSRFGKRDKSFHFDPPARSRNAWRELERGFSNIIAKHPKVMTRRVLEQIGTLGSGNHFIELCLDESDQVWIMLHSGSRGIGNSIGTYFIERARQDMARIGVDLPDRDLAYFVEDTPGFRDYFEAVEWAQDYAAQNRRCMMEAILDALRALPGLPKFKPRLEVINCHHNYVARERHFGEDVLVTRKGAVRAGLGEMGIIPGSMGARSFIVRGKGNPESFESCSHGAGRLMSRTEARRRFSLDEHLDATKHVECRRDAAVLDETPGAYKPIDAVMAAQSDLVDIVHTLRQIVCVKGA